MTETKRRRGRWIALGTILGVVSVWGGFGVLDAAPSSITTCTKVNNGRMKIITSSAVAKCTNKGKGVADTWAPTSQFAALQRYQTLLRGSTACGGTTDNFTDMELGQMMLPWCLAGADLSGSGLVNADLSGVFLADADLSRARLSFADFSGAFLGGATTTGASADFAVWNLTVCPDETRSDTNGTSPESCVGHGF